MSSQPSEFFRTPRVAKSGPTPMGAIQTWSEALQTADSVPRVLEITRCALDERPDTGRGAIYLIDESGSLQRAEVVRGRAESNLATPAIELEAMARRALREGKTVRQTGLSAGSLWASPLRSPKGFEGVVVVVGEPDGALELMGQAGAALFREQARSREALRSRRLGARTVDLERGVEVLDAILRRSGSVLRRIARAISEFDGFGRVTLWTLRAEDGRYVEGVSTVPGATDSFSVPETAYRSEGFVEWSATFPRWGGHPWIPAEGTHRLRPGPGDTLLLVLQGHEGTHPLGFVLAEVTHSLEDAESLSDLRRWITLAHLALDAQARRGRGSSAEREREEAAELHRMKSQFIAAVSHELRTPLTSITAYAETLRGLDAADADGTRDRFLGVIHDESRRLTRIVDDILDLATMDAGRVRMSCRRIDLTRVARDSVDVIRPLASDKGIEIRISARSTAPVHADPDLLKQLTVNLLENATKFSAPGGHIALDVETNATAVRLIVEDDGPGIPPDKLDAVFERFFQVDGSNVRAHGGSGLGLAICRNIATWHDGRIWAESAEGKGARFVVSLPRVRATSRSRTIEPSLEGARTDAHHVPELLIEMISEVMRVESVSLMLLEPSGNELFIQAALGLPDETVRDVRVAVGDRIAGKVASSGETLLVPDLETDDRFATSGHPHQYRTRSLISAPVKLRNSVIGVVNVTNKISGRSFSEEDRRLLEILAQRVALVLSKMREFGDSLDDVRRMEDAMRGVIDVRRHYFPASERFSRLVLGVCQELGLDEDEAARIHYAAIVRDVGMTRLPEGTYKKPAKLTDGDRTLIRSHPEEGARVLRPIEFQPDVFDIILAHHEEPDGTGYPKGLTDQGIPVGAKVLAVVDAYDALRVGRPYRAAVSEYAALEELQRHVGRQFDSSVVEALVRTLERQREHVVT